MTIILSHPLNAQEIRVLQEFRRLSTQTLSLDAINAIKHPAGGGEEPALSLAAKGYLTGSNGGFSLAPKGVEFLKLDPKPLVQAPHNPEAAVSEEEET